MEWKIGKGMRTKNHTEDVEYVYVVDPQKLTHPNGGGEKTTIYPPLRSIALEQI